MPEDHQKKAAAREAHTRLSGQLTTRRVQPNSSVKEVSAEKHNAKLLETFRRGLADHTRQQLARATNKVCDELDRLAGTQDLAQFERISLALECLEECDRFARWLPKGFEHTAGIDQVWHWLHFAAAAAETATRLQDPIDCREMVGMALRNLGRAEAAAEAFQAHQKKTSKIKPGRPDPVAEAIQRNPSRKDIDIAAELDVHPRTVKRARDRLKENNGQN